MVAWNKMSFKDAERKALSYNRNLVIIKIYRDSKLKFDIVCPCCNKEIIIGTNMSSIKNNTLSCKQCKKNKIGMSNSKVKQGNSFKENDLYGRLKYWDYSKNTLTPDEINKNSGKHFWFKCEEGHSFALAISDINNGRWCIHCNNLQKESKMASALKQVLKHIFPNTVWEYNIGFRGFNGGVSNYDIYIPEINLIIECQSQYHDEENQKELDILKKQYAIKNGYDFLEIDHRDYSPLEAIQLFIPKLSEIPSYVDYNKNTRITWDVKKAQYLLDNSNLSQKEIAEQVGAEIKSFYSAVSYKALIVPKDKKIEIPIIQLSLEGEFIKEYKSARECYNHTGFITSNICNCCKHIQQTYKGFLWIYKDEYEDIKDKCGNICVSKEAFEKYNKNTTKSVYQLSLCGEFIKEYDSISDVEKQTKYSLKNISACCYNKRAKTSNGFIWMFKNDYIDLSSMDVITPKNIIKYKENKYSKL